MQLNYQKNNATTAIVYGEILSSSIHPEMFANKHIIVLTNQRYYDHFFEKIQHIFSPQTIDWYVCSNLIYGNHVRELMDILDFLGQFFPNEEYLFVAFGNEGVIQLTGFIQKTTILSGDFWVLPTTLRSFVAALFEERFICKQSMEMLLIEKNLPEKIFLDQTIVAGQNDGKLVDLQAFIRVGLVYNYAFLQTLFKNFPNRKQVQSTSFIAFVSQVIESYQQASKEIEGFGKIFEEAFYHTENGHLLSENMKRFLGMVLHLFWNLEIIETTFRIKNFMIWLKHLGFPIVFPEQISVAEYLQNVLHLQKKYPQLVVLSEIGTIGREQSITENQLIQSMEHYQKMIAEI